MKKNIFYALLLISSLNQIQASSLEDKIVSYYLELTTNISNKIIIDSADSIKHFGKEKFYINEDALIFKSEQDKSALLLLISGELLHIPLLFKD